MRAEKLGTKALNLIKKYLLFEALDLLDSYHLREDREKCIVLLTAQLVRLNRLRNSNLISPEFYCLKENQMMESMLELAYAIKAEKKKTIKIFASCSLFF